jgi:hypothetical protein
MQPTAADERTTLEIVYAMYDDIAKIVRYKVRMVRVEIAEEFRNLKEGLIALGIASCLGVLAFGLLLLGLMEGLRIILPDWLASLFVGGLVGLGGALLLVLGIHEMRR